MNDTIVFRYLVLVAENDAIPAERRDPKIGILRRLRELMDSYEDALSRIPIEQ